MDRTDGNEDSGRRQAAFGLAALGLLGQVGCVTILMIAISIGGGLFLDAQFGTRPWITVGLLIASVPVTMFLMFKIVLAFAPKVQMNALPVGSDKLAETAVQEDEQLGD
jgi:MYXO-CTERM domain-containing protein